MFFIGEKRSATESINYIFVDRCCCEILVRLQSAQVHNQGLTGCIDEIPRISFGSRSFQIMQETLEIIQEFPK